jgi:hypothetical protein
MDPELLQLYLSAFSNLNNAKKGDSLLQSALLGALTGQGFNPAAYSQSSAADAPILSRYSQDPNPAIQQLVQQVNTGADQFEIESLANRIFATNSEDVAASGFSADTFLKLGREMVKERDTAGSSGSSKSSKGFDFGKAGFSNPADIYDAYTVPLNNAQQSLANAYSDVQNEYTTKYNQSRSKATDIMGRLDKSKGMTRSFSGKELAKIINDISYGELGFSTGTGGRKEMLADWLKKQNNISDKDLNAAFDRFGASVPDPTSAKHFEKFASLARRNIAGSKTPVITQAEVDTSTPEFYNFRKAIDEARRAGKMSGAARSKEMGIRQGALESAKSAGQTPFSDEIKARLAVLAKLG